MGEPESAPFEFSDIQTLFDSSTPFTTRELAEQLEYSYGAVQEQLITLSDRGLLETKQTGDNNRIWWYLPGTTGHSQKRSKEMRNLQFEELVDAVVDYAIFVLDADGYIQTWNSGARRKKGYTEAESIGKHLSIFYTQEDIANGVPERNLKTAAACGQVEDEGWRVRKDGSRFWADVVLSAFYDDSGNVAGFVKVTRDMTERHQYDRRLEEQNKRLQQQNNRLNQFASMLAHELRNPLTIAQIYLQQAAQGDAAAVEQVDEALDRIEEMIEVLLITTRGSDVDGEWNSIKLRKAAQQAWESVTTPDSELIVDTDRRINADPTHLHHILENLFRNAVTHSDGAVTVRVGGLPTGFFVADTGSGIPTEQRNEVFDPWFTTTEDGTGFGLAFVRHLASVYGWEVRVVESESGGARFEIIEVDDVEELGDDGIGSREE